jgi:ubiquitin carboxyl-terminal hydrolase L3
MAKLGFPIELLSWTDVLSTEDWALDMVPSPVSAVALLFPIKEASEAFKDAQEARVRAEGEAAPPALYFTKQTVGNACGTVAILHSVANCTAVSGGAVPLAAGGWFAGFLERTKGLSPEARAEALEDDQEVEEQHGEVAVQGQSAVVEDVETHFVAFVEKGGRLWELDGRKAFPISHGATSAERLLADACAVIRRDFMDRDPGEVRFTITALAPPAADE